MAKKKAPTTSPLVKQPAPSPIDTDNFPIVGIGASAGGLEALETLFGAMPDNSGLGFVLVAHLDPSHSSILGTLIQRHTKMPVCQAEDGMKVEIDHLYVIPPNKDLSIENGSLQLLDRLNSKLSHLPIDSFFQSLASDKGHMAIGVILSGTGSDGTIGIKDIKGNLGLAIAQDPDTAKYPGMPISALDSGMIDFKLPPGKIPQQLIQYAKQLSSPSPLGKDPGKNAPSLFLQKVFAILRAKTDQDFSQYKANTICRRIERRMNVHQIDSLDNYVQFLQESTQEAEVLFKELLIGVTNFFRDPLAFMALQSEVLPSLLAKKPNDYQFRVWIPGCASGEEVYSIAIVLHETFEKLGRHAQIQIFGTDLDSEAIEFARGGLYPESVGVDIGADRLKRYFTQEDDGQYRVKTMIREMVVFARQNVIKDPPFTKLDLLSCRNLLIYLGSDLQSKLFPIFHYSLKSEGVLFLGSSETVGLGSRLFSVIDKKWKIFQRTPLDTPREPFPLFPAQAISPKRTSTQTYPSAQKDDELKIIQLVETILHQSGALPCVVINDASDVVYIHGRTGKFLEPPEGKATTNILKMARPGLESEMANAIRQVAVTSSRLTCSGLEIIEGDQSTLLNLTVTPVLENPELKGYKMVIFEEIAEPSQSESTKSKKPTPKKNSRNVEELEKDLQRTRHSLQTTIEELEASNEELKSTNEELQSTNEELQSTNEELETSKEELQSLNEESATVNSELQSRIEELSKSNDDMKNLLDSTAIATVFLDTDLCIRRYTNESTRILPLTPSDIGRPINDLSCTLLDISLLQLGETVLRDLGVCEIEANSKDGKHFTVRVRPYRTTANVIDGVVLTFEDCTERTTVQAALKESEFRYRKLFDMSSDPLAILNVTDLKFTDFNKSTYQELGYSQKEFASLSLKEISTPKSMKSLKTNLAKVKANGSLSFKSEHITKDGKTRPVEVSCEAIELGDGEYVLSTWRY